MVDVLLVNHVVDVLLMNLRWRAMQHLSLQVLLFGRAGAPLGPLRRARMYFEFQRRLTD